MQQFGSEQTYIPWVRILTFLTNFCVVQFCLIDLYLRTAIKRQVHEVQIRIISHDILQTLFLWFGTELIPWFHLQSIVPFSYNLVIFLLSKHTRCFLCDAQILAIWQRRVLQRCHTSYFLESCCFLTNRQGLHVLSKLKHMCPDSSRLSTASLRLLPRFTRCPPGQ